MFNATGSCSCAQVLQHSIVPAKPCNQSENPGIKTKLPERRLLAVPPGRLMWGPASAVRTAHQPPGTCRGQSTLSADPKLVVRSHQRRPLAQLTTDGKSKIS